MNDVRNKILNDTIVTLTNCNIAVHRSKVGGLSVNAIVELVKLIEESAKDVSIDLVNKGKPLAIPSIGNIKIKENKLKYLSKYKELLKQYKVSHEDELCINDREKFNKEIDNLRIDLVKRSNTRLKNEFRNNLTKNLIKSIQKD